MQKIIGHDATTYVIGGNASYNIRGNILDWESDNKLNKIELTNQILNLPNKLDSNELVIMLKKLLNLQNIDFVKFLEKSLNLREAIIIQLRRLFYSFDKFDSLSKKNKVFCHKDPKTCILTLIKNSSLNLSHLNLSNLEKSLEEIISDIENEIKKREELRSFLSFKDGNDKKNKDKKNKDKKIEKYMSILINRCKVALPTLEQIEQSNNAIAKHMERMANIMEIKVQGGITEKTGITGITEKTEVYEIKASKISDKDIDSWLNMKPSLVDILSEDNMFNPNLTDSQSIRDLWAQKSRLDSFFDKNQAELYYKARDTIFPQDKKGSKKFGNRAGDKFYEIDTATKLINLGGGVFFDVCGGPGAWSEVLLDKGNWTGFGLTLTSTDKSTTWYNKLLNDSRWTALYGVDGTGDVYKTANLDDSVTKIKKSKREITLLIGDGGFHIKTNSAGQHMEHLQELYSTRIILSELLICLKCLAAGGSWCCKLFDSFSYFTASIIYITAICFESTYIVKPLRSRIVNSERYLIGKNLKSDNVEQIVNHLTKIHSEWPNDNNIKYVESLVPIEVMKGDTNFWESTSAEVRNLCSKQTMALKKVMDLAEQKRNKKKSM